MGSVECQLVQQNKRVELGTGSSLKKPSRISRAMFAHRVKLSRAAQRIDSPTQSNPTLHVPKCMFWIRVKKSQLINFISPVIASLTQ